MESELVTADAIDAAEYPELSERYQVYAVPLTVANSHVRIEGAMPESMFVDRMLKGVGAQI